MVVQRSTKLELPVRLEVQVDVPRMPRVLVEVPNRRRASPYRQVPESDRMVD